MNKPVRHSLSALHGETARISWSELETHFARGVVLRVETGLDLVKVASCFANDDRVVVEKWLDLEQVQPLDTQTARRWSRCETDLWAVVVAPWVLVQEPMP